MDDAQIEFTDIDNITRELEIECLSLGVVYDELVNVNINLFLDEIILVIKEKNQEKLNMCQNIPQSVKMAIKRCENNDDFTKLINKLTDIVERVKFCQNKDNYEEEINVPDSQTLKHMKNNILEIAKIVKNDKNKTPYNTLSKKMEEDFPKVPFPIIKMLVEKSQDIQKNLPQILKLVEMADQVASKRVDYNAANMQVEETLRSGYVYPKFGGKHNFYKTIDEMKNRCEEKAKNNKQ